MVKHIIRTNQMRIKGESVDDLYRGVDTQFYDVQRYYVGLLWKGVLVW